MARPSKTNLERFEAKYQEEPFSGCWMWTATVTKRHYGVFNVRDDDGTWHSEHARTFSYRTFSGAIPEGKEIEMVCRNRRCVNPSHMKLVEAGIAWTRSEPPSHKAHRMNLCSRGHDLLLYGRERPNGTRACRACDKERKRARRRDRAYLAHELQLHRQRRRKKETVGS